MRSESNASSNGGTPYDMYPGGEHQTRRGGKRAKVLVPADRKAFYALVSLLIDKNSIPSDVIVTVDNYSSFVSADKLACIEKLKEVLSYEC